MQTHWLWKASTLGLAAALALSVGTNLANAGPAVEGPQPHMKAALESLQAAKAQLDKASSDKGGHRAKAMVATKEAIEQVKKGIAFDNEHGGDKKMDDVTVIESAE
jgi:hypothetical protein